MLLRALPLRFCACPEVPHRSAFAYVTNLKESNYCSLPQGGCRSAALRSHGLPRQAKLSEQAYSPSRDVFWSPSKESNPVPRGTKTDIIQINVSGAINLERQTGLEPVILRWQRWSCTNHQSLKFGCPRWSRTSLNQLLFLRRIRTRRYRTLNWNT